MSKAGDRILASIREARAIARGEVTEGFIVHRIPDVDVRAIRARQNLSQAEFARRYGFSAAAVRDWEQRRRQPQRSARVLLMVIDRNPEIVDEIIQDLPTA
jgi:putative transcriptional regulator